MTLGGGGGGVFLRWTGILSSLSIARVKQLNKFIHRRAGQPTQAVSRLSEGQCQTERGRAPPLAAQLGLVVRDGRGSPVTLVSLYGITVLFSYRLALPLVLYNSVPQQKTKLSNLLKKKKKTNKYNLHRF